MTMQSARETNQSQRFRVWRSNQHSYPRHKSKYRVVPTKLVILMMQIRWPSNSLLQLNFRRRVQARF